jgi:hypothetical protein
MQVSQFCVSLTTIGGGNAIDYAIRSSFSIGPLSMRTEVIARATTSSAAPSTLFTDDEGLEMHARPLRNDEMLSANYHACVSACHMTSSLGQVTVLVPHTMAIASLWDGAMELMLHRKMNTSDSQGVRCALRAVCLCPCAFVCICVYLWVFVGICVCVRECVSALPLRLCCHSSAAPFSSRITWFPHPTLTSTSISNPHLLSPPPPPTPPLPSPTPTTRRRP